MTIKPDRRTKLSGWNIAEGAVLAIVLASMLGALAILTYQCSTSTGPFRREYSGRIVDKRISVIETQEGSRFARELVIEEKSASRFTVTVTQDDYERAKPGMWIQKTPKGTEFLPDPAQNSAGQ